MFLSTGVQTNNLDLDERLMPLDESQMIGILIGPLKLMVQSKEILNNYWVRNGEMIEWVAKYVNWPKNIQQTVDADVYLVQACLSRISQPGDTLIDMLFKYMYGNEHCLSLQDCENLTDHQKSAQTNLFKDVLTILINVISFKKFVVQGGLVEVLRKWAKVVENGRKWPKMAEKGQKRPKKGRKRPKIARK